MKISIIIPTFNEKKIVRECLDRLLKQSRKADEIIFVDESKDETPKLIGGYAREDKSVRLFHFDEKKGVSFSKNFVSRTSSVVYFIVAFFVFLMNSERSSPLETMYQKVRSLPSRTALTASSFSSPMLVSRKANENS